MADAEAFTLLALALVVIALRIWARWVQVGPSNWQLDDYLMPLTGSLHSRDSRRIPCRRSFQWSHEFLYDP